MTALLLTALLAPFTASIALVVWGRVRPGTSPAAAGWVSTGAAAVFLAAVIGLAGSDAATHLTWLETGSFPLTIGVTVTGLTWFAALLVAGVSLLVAVYSVGYMAESEGHLRFFAELSFFTGSMLTLVLADSLLLLFAAWEAVGVASFLLIGFHFEQSDARRGAYKAFVMTRLGDLGFLLAWLLLLQETGSVRISEVLGAVEGGALSDPRLTLIALLLFAAAVGKSAQLPLTAWLPAAMAGPTPVSALIHSATMVAAGVFLVLRLFPLFERAPVALDVLLWTGLVTAFLAALVATIQVDFKRVLAWSTVSQLGEMVLALGLGAPLAAAYHLAAHATFKATLFLTAGAVDHGAGTRDLRRLGGLARHMPLTASFMIVAALALAGIPPFAGFWSEELILSAAVQNRPWVAVALLGLIFLAGFYIGRAVTAILEPWPGAPRPRAEEPKATMLTSTAVLAAGAAVSGGVLALWGARLLPFEEHAPGPVAWRVGAVLLGALGLLLGRTLVRRYGPIAPLRLVALPLENFVELLFVGAGRLVLLVG